MYDFSSFLEVLPLKEVLGKKGACEVVLGLMEEDEMPYDASLWQDSLNQLEQIKIFLFRKTEMYGLTNNQNSMFKI